MNLLEGVAVVRPGDSFEHWHQVTCRNFSLTQSNWLADREFSARVSLREFGPLCFSEIWSSTTADDLIRVTRNPCEIRRDPRDYFMLWLGLGGETAVAQSGRDALLRQGDLIFYDQAQPFTLAFGRLAHAAMITVPRPLLVSRMPAAAQLTACRVSSQTRLGAFAGSILRQLFCLDAGVDDELAPRLGAAALDLLTTALEAELTGRGGPAQFQDRRLAEVKRFILANLHDSELDLKTIASRQNIAPRTLNRLFAREATTPIRWLWRQRLAGAYRALADRRIDRVTDAALSFGFSDMAHFSRAFKAAFRQSPQAVRRGRCQK
jgi:AraC-like DNA-binding protein